MRALPADALARGQQALCLSYAAEDILGPMRTRAPGAFANLEQCNVQLSGERIAGIRPAAVAAQAMSNINAVNRTAEFPRCRTPNLT